MYEFLRVLGCQFFAHDLSMAEELPAKPPAVLPPMDKTVKPLYEYRDNNEYIPTKYAVRCLQLWVSRIC